MNSIFLKPVFLFGLTCIVSFLATSQDLRGQIDLKFTEGISKGIPKDGVSVVKRIVIFTIIRPNGTEEKHSFVIEQWEQEMFGKTFYDPMENLVAYGWLVEGQHDQRQEIQQVANEGIQGLAMDVFSKNIGKLKRAPRNRFVNELKRIVRKREAAKNELLLDFQPIQVEAAMARENISVAPFRAITKSRLFEALELTPEQVKEIDRLGTAYQKEVQAIEDEVEKEAESLIEDQSNQIKDILNQNQRSMLRKLIGKDGPNLE